MSDSEPDSEGGLFDVVEVDSGSEDTGPSSLGGEDHTDLGFYRRGYVYINFQS